MFALLDFSGLGLRSTEFTARLLDEASVVAVPGTAFGDQGHGYFQISFAEGEITLNAAAAAIRAFAEMCLNSTSSAVRSEHMA